jgi:hypothetical protein
MGNKELEKVLDELKNTKKIFVEVIQNGELKGKFKRTTRNGLQVHHKSTR